MSTSPRWCRTFLAWAAAEASCRSSTIFYEQYGTHGSGQHPGAVQPAEISLTKSANWEQQHAAGQGDQSSASVEQEFRSVEAETFSIELFFDTYGSRVKRGDRGGAPRPRPCWPA